VLKFNFMMEGNSKHNICKHVDVMVDIESIAE